MPRFSLAASECRSQQPGAQQARAHPGCRPINYVQQGTSRTVGAQRLDQFEIADCDVVEDQMILGLEKNNIVDMSSGGPLRFHRVSQTSSRRDDCFGAPGQAKTVERFHPEMADK